MYIFIKSPVPRIYNGLLQLDNKNTDNLIKMGTGFEQTFLQRMYKFPVRTWNGVQHHAPSMKRKQELRLLLHARWGDITRKMGGNKRWRGRGETGNSSVVCGSVEWCM